MKRITSLFICLLVGFNSYSQSNKKLIIAFGSCNKQAEPQPMWNVIASYQPNLWIWLGDNIYGDSNDMQVLKDKYQLQLGQADYKKFTSTVPVIGTWDDHDYGQNDAGKEYPYKQESQQLALDFLNEPKDSPRRNQEGIYSSYVYKAGRKAVKVILLDTRYHRDAILKNEKKINIPNPDGDVLGEKQWQWLENQLDDKADAFVIGSSIQVLAEEHRSEKWANFPTAKKRLLDLLVRKQVKGAIILSGDRHIGEFSKITFPGLNYPVYDITSSGLTHSSTSNSDINKYRVGPIVNQKNFGILEFKGKRKSLRVTMYLKGLKSETLHSEKLKI